MEEVTWMNKNKMDEIYSLLGMVGDLNELD